MRLGCFSIPQSHLNYIIFCEDRNYHVWDVLIRKLSGQDVGSARRKLDWPLDRQGWLQGTAVIWKAPNCWQRWLEMTSEQRTWLSSWLRHYTSVVISRIKVQSRINSTHLCSLHADQRSCANHPLSKLARAKLLSLKGIITFFWWPSTIWLWFTEGLSGLHAFLYMKPAPEL